MKKVMFGRLAGIEFSATPPAFVGSALLWLVLSILGSVFLTLTPLQAILGGFLALILHWSGEIFHQLGHAWAARRTGYPMTGIPGWVLLASWPWPYTRVTNQIYRRKSIFAGHWADRPPV